MKTPKVVRNSSLHLTAKRRVLAFIFATALLSCALPASAQRQPTPLAKPKTNAAPAAIPAVRADPGVDPHAIGARIYSTGLEPIWVRIVPKPPGDATYLSRVYVEVQGVKRYIGHNRENKTVNLGKVAPGDLQILIETPAEGVWSSGPGAGNADELPHAAARDLSEGLVEVRFEDLRGLREEPLTHGNPTQRAYARQHYFGDVILQVGGGVTADSTVPMLIESLQSSNSELKKTAAEALRQTHPRLARSLGLNAPVRNPQTGWK